MIKKLDMLVLILLPAIAVFASLVIKAGLLASTLLFYGLPAVYFSLRNKHAVKRALVAAIAGIPALFAADYLAVQSQAWYVPNPFLPRVLGIVPLDDLIWGFSLVYVVIMFYEHFLDKSQHNIVDRKFKYIVYVFFCAFVAVLSFHFLRPGLLRISYYYFTFVAIVGFLPVVLFLSHYPRFLGKYAKVIIYFTSLNLIFELTGLQLGQWVFPGKEYIGSIELFNFRFPFEKLFFYIILSSVAVLSYFEYFDDNHLKREARGYT